jgi:hypothetical protein
MKALSQHAAALLLLAPGVGLGRRLNSASASPSTESRITTVSFVNATEGTITISGDDTPLGVGADATIVVDGRPATLHDVRKGMEVISRTADGSSVSELDVKTIQS